MGREHMDRVEDGYERNNYMGIYNGERPEKANDNLSMRIDIMKEYDRNPEEVLRLLASQRSGSTPVFNIPYAYDLSTYPRSEHYTRIVSVYGTVMKMGLLKFKEVGSRKIDYQEIKIQERNTLYLPRTINIQLQGRLIDSCKPGEVVRVAGVVEVLWRRLKAGLPIECEYSIRALEITRQKIHNKENVDVLPECEFSLLKEVLDAYAPSLAGLRQTKLAMLVCTIGGQESTKDVHAKDKESGSVQERESTLAEQMYYEMQSKNRVSSHILLVGKTGSGKSTLLGFAAKTAVPAVRTTGTSCTSAGLTACATRENNDWMIEPGAIPQADRGICCIDDFGSLRKEEKASILEAMEQQTITIAKAGIILKLDTRCTIIGAARHNTEAEWALQSLKLSPPLLSRFDLIMGIDDLLASDEEIALKNLEKQPEEKCEMFIRDLIEERKKTQVTLSEECKLIIEMYYRRLKEIDNVSIRALESHIRLCEGYAKLMGKTTATETHALMMVLLLNSSLSTKKIWRYTLDALLGSKNMLDAALSYIKHDLLTE
ncbi:DNA helicase MCM9 [Nematocida ausubeli]|nr:DNA helicase MCM9 [Nematocida ausubeli]KAI5161044.1 DNA helicase MCM9 [Nematocida ausubeli]